MRLRYLTVPAASFNSSLAKNIGAHYSTGCFLFFLDADITLSSDVLAEARRPLERRPIVLQVRTVRESDPPSAQALEGVKELVDTRELTFTDGRHVRLRFMKSAEGGRCGSGLLLMHRRHFIDVVGFNSALAGWDSRISTSRSGCKRLAASH